MLYDVDFAPDALEHIELLAKNEPKAFNKLQKLVKELEEHPTTGTGKPHRLTGDRAGQWSRSITKKHRLVYEINGQCVQVYVLSAYGHYDDK